MGKSWSWTFTGTGGPLDGVKIDKHGSEVKDSGKGGKGSGKGK